VILRQPAKTLAQVNQAIGDISEQVMIRHFESSGWQAIPGQIGRTGIDGLFIKRNRDGVVREVLVAESKANTGTLQSTNHGEQMSRDWVLRKVKQLREQRSQDSIYLRVGELIEGGFYRARLWTMRVEGDEIRLDLQRIRSHSDKVDDLLDDPGTRVLTPPGSIRIATPKDHFEKTIVSAYREALDKLGPDR
jgi:hypothetical protein